MPNESAEPRTESNAQVNEFSVEAARLEYEKPRLVIWTKHDELVLRAMHIAAAATVREQAAPPQSAQDIRDAALEDAALIADARWNESRGRFEEEYRAGCQDASLRIACDIRARIGIPKKGRPQ